LEAREQNLQALRDNYIKQASAAQSAQDFEREMQFRTKAEAASKAHQLVLESLHQKGAWELEKERNKGDVEREAVRQKGVLAETAATHRARLAEIAATGAENRKTLLARPKLTQAERSASVRQGINPDSGFLIPGFAMAEQSKRMTLGPAAGQPAGPRRGVQRDVGNRHAAVGQRQDAREDDGPPDGGPEPIQGNDAEECHLRTHRRENLPQGAGQVGQGPRRGRPSRSDGP